MIPLAKKSFHELLAESEERGKDASGCAFVSPLCGKHHLFTYKKPVASSVLITQKDYKSLWRSSNPSIAIGHSRAKTQGDQNDNNNNHPVVCESLAVVHNGMIGNDEQVFEDFKLKRRGEVDSEAIVSLVAYYKFVKNFKTITAIQHMAKETRGSMACAMIDSKEPDTLYLWASTSPLNVVYQQSTGTVYFASTVDIAKRALIEMTSILGFFNVQKNPGDFLIQQVADDTGLVITPRGIQTFSIERKAWTAQGSYTGGRQQSWLNKDGERYCQTCFMYQPLVHECNFMRMDVIKKPGKYSTKQLEDRLETLYDLEESRELSLEETAEVNRVNDTLNKRLVQKIERTADRSLARVN